MESIFSVLLPTIQNLEASDNGLTFAFWDGVPMKIVLSTTDQIAAFEKAKETVIAYKESKEKEWLGESPTQELRKIVNKRMESFPKEIKVEEKLVHKIGI
jgi:hypothetical protein